MLNEGLRISLDGQVEKFSQTLQRNAVYTQKKTINRLPGYLCIQFVRFYWKSANASSGTEAGKAKILRKVQYPRVLDVYEFCSDELKKSLDAGREFERNEREVEDAKRLAGLKAADEEAKLAKEKEGKKGNDVEMEDEEAK